MEHESLLRTMDGAIEARSEALATRLAELIGREARVGERENAALQRGDAHLLLDLVTALERRNGELRQANEKLVLATLAAEELREEAQRLNERQEEFLAMLAHELRNPLAPISAAVELIARQGNKAAPRSLEIIRRQVRHMVRLVDDLLDVSRVTHGKVVLQRRPMEVAGALRQAVETCNELITARRQRLTLTMPPPSPWVDADPVRLAQIFVNLLQNAAKYTQEGGEIDITLVAHDETAEVRIRDNGCGISAQALPHVFDLFTQDDRTLDRRQGGLGIGLTVVRRMVELHGGSVVAHSEGRQLGSEFVVSLPSIRSDGDAARLDSPTQTRDVAGTAGEADEADVVDSVAAVDATARPAASVLLVEDNLDTAQTLADLLRLSGHVVHHASDGASALEDFARLRPQVVLCDIGLPGMDGYDVAAAMRGLQHDPAPVLVALTGYGSRQDAERALTAGFDLHLAKPAEHGAVLRLVDAALHPRESP